jgi:mono/diheme cytochrome c family protein
MTSERAAIAFAVFGAVASALGGCADFSRGPAPVAIDAGASEGGTDAAASFAEVEAILAGNCQRCHAMGGEAGDTTFLLTGDPASDHATVLNFVDVNAPGASRLLAKMSGNGHGGGTVFAAGTPEYQTVLHWIQEGAPQ